MCCWCSMSQSQFNWTDRLQVGVILLKEHEEAHQPPAGPSTGQAQITAIRTVAEDKQASQRSAALEHAFGAAVLVDKDQRSLIKHTVSSALQGGQSTILVHGPACAAKVHFMLGPDGLLAQVVREIELCHPDGVTVLTPSAPAAPAASTAMDCDVSQLIHMMQMSYAQRTEAVVVIRFVVSIAGKVTGIAVVDFADPSPSTPSSPSSTPSTSSSFSSFSACCMDCGSKDASYRALGDALFALSEGIPADHSTLLPQMLAEHLTSSTHTAILVCIPADSEGHAGALVVADVCCKLKGGSVLLDRQPELIDPLDCQRILTKAQQQVPELPMNEETVQLQSPLVYHAVGCVGCASAVCAAIKSSLAHAERCRLTMQGGCKVCKHVSNLLSAHARRCQLDRCKVPHCNATRYSTPPCLCFCAFLTSEPLYAGSIGPTNRQWSPASP